MTSNQDPSFDNQDLSTTSESSPSNNSALSSQNSPSNNSTPSSQNSPSNNSAKSQSQGLSNWILGGGLAALIVAAATLIAAIARTDGWGAYGRHLPLESHEIGKRKTRRIERKHLNLRTRIKRLTRKTICFSKMEEMHDLAIGLFINRYEFGLEI